ncbi:MAG TPA: hypothetical protein VFM79_07595, partial [Pelobium sp.]|nr:hypothetical protein [Pelobium sp.]
ITNNNLESLQLKTGVYKLNKIDGKNLLVKIETAGLKVSNVSFKTLSILADSAKWIDINTSKVDLFQYSLQNNSKLNLGKNEIKNFQKLSADSLSKISVQGYASDMEKFLPVLSK